MAELALLLLTLAWGTTFSFVKEALAFSSPGVFLTARFAVATTVLGAIWAFRRPTLGEGFWRRSTLLGLATLGGFVFQTLGLRHTTPSRSGFITGLSVLVVPILARYLFKRAVRPAVWVGVLLAVAGMVCLSRPFGAEQLPDDVRWGDLLTFACAVAYALQISWTSEWSSRHPLVPFVAVQVAVTLVGSALLVPVDGFRLDPAGAATFTWVVLYTGVVMTAGALFVMNWGQRHTTAVRAALIFALEPVAAALFSWAYLHEPLVALDWIGGGLMVAGVLVGELGSLLGPRPAPGLAVGHAPAE